MNHSRLLMVLLAGIACIATWIYHDVTAAQEKATPVPGTQWEYKIMYGIDLIRLAAVPAKPSSGDIDEVETGLNKLGAENWELVDVTYSGDKTFQYSLKRPKTSK